MLDVDDRYDAGISHMVEGQRDEAVIRNGMSRDECAAWIAEHLAQVEPGNGVDIEVRRGFE